MKFEEVQLIQEKALKVLKQHSIKDSLMWIINHYKQEDFEQWEEQRRLAKQNNYDLNDIEQAKSFKYHENEYEMYFFDMSSYSAMYNEGEGKFRLYVNKEIVLETRCGKYSLNDWSIDLDFSKIVKLGDWVKELSEFVEFKKTEDEKIKKIEEIEVEEYIKNTFIEETKENFDLGDFENE